MLQLRGEEVKIVALTTEEMRNKSTNGDKRGSKNDGTCVGDLLLMSVLCNSSITHSLMLFLTWLIATLTLESNVRLNKSRIIPPEQMTGFMRQTV